ncbi:MAG: ABC transporter permease [Verrucomicrobiota bacterium]
MSITLGIIEGFREVWTHKFRSLLTGIGVVLGVASLMTMFAITNGQAISFRKGFELWGGVEKVFIIDRPVPEEQESIRDQSPGRSYADVIALRKAPFIESVSPEIRLKRGGAIEYQGEKFYSRWIRGVESAFLDVENYELEVGRFITEFDQQSRTRVIVMGRQIKEILFGQQPEEELLGKQVLLNGVKFRVIGFLKPFNNRFKDSVAVVPFLTMQELFFSSNVVKGVDLGPIRRVDRIIVKIRDAELLDDSLEQMRNILLQTHNGVEDFGFRTSEGWFETVESSVKGVRLSGFIVSGITLIAAGVGITNIMMASIRERTREIGVRRSIGAGQWDIFVQICMEALVLAALGGIAGLGVGFAMVDLFKEMLSEYSVPVLNSQAVVISFIASVFIGFLAGVAPAIQASQMKPIEALRFE